VQPLLLLLLLLLLQLLSNRGAPGQHRRFAGVLQPLLLLLLRDESGAPQANRRLKRDLKIGSCCAFCAAAADLKTRAGPPSSPALWLNTMLLSLTPPCSNSNSNSSSSTTIEFVLCSL
jgi:hypothetical protein